LRVCVGVREESSIAPAAGVDGAKEIGDVISGQLLLDDYPNAKYYCTEDDPLLT
jgi:hypothetical protein